MTKVHHGNSLLVIGDAGPGSGHTCSLGKVRQLPAASFFANEVILGPDSAIDLLVLEKDLESVRAHRPDIKVRIAGQASVVREGHLQYEREIKLDKRIGSTVTGGGAARSKKHFFRDDNERVIDYRVAFEALGVDVLGRSEYMKILEAANSPYCDVLFECSQGTLLDVDFGHYPFVTSRSTLPRVALERNGLDSRQFKMHGVMRAAPIRTGGNTGPTGASETTWDAIGTSAEIASVTGRRRRVFEYSGTDTAEALQLTDPDVIYITHVDHANSSIMFVVHDNLNPWLVSKKGRMIFESHAPALFHQV